MNATCAAILEARAERVPPLPGRDVITVQRASSPWCVRGRGVGALVFEAVIANGGLQRAAWPARPCDPRGGEGRHADGGGTTSSRGSSPRSNAAEVADRSARLRARLGVSFRSGRSRSTPTRCGGVARPAPARAHLDRHASAPPSSASRGAPGLAAPHRGRHAGVTSSPIAAIERLERSLCGCPAEPPLWRRWWRRVRRAENFILGVGPCDGERDDRAGARDMTLADRLRAPIPRCAARPSPSWPSGAGGPRRTGALADCLGAGGRP